jgi:hypothetical protein
MESAGTPFREFFLRRMQPRKAFLNLTFLGSVSLTPVSDRILGHCMSSGTFFFFRKIALSERIAVFQRRLSVRGVIFDVGVLENRDVWTCRWILFRRNILPQSTGLKMVNIQGVHKILDIL